MSFIRNLQKQVYWSVLCKCLCFSTHSWNSLPLLLLCSLCLSPGLQNREWASILEILSSRVWENFNRNCNKGVWFQHHLQNLVAFATTCKRAILWIYGHVFPVVILILGSLPHCVSSDLYWTLNTLGKAQGVGLHWNKGLGGRPEGGGQIWKSFAPDTITWCKNFTRFLYKISCDTQWVEAHAILFKSLSGYCT